MRSNPRKLVNYKEFPLLYVDDEVENLRVFEITFRREFEVLTATSAEEGLRLLAEHPIAVVLSDHRMPGMSGVEFLARARDLDPSILRILVTAYGDVDTLRSAINDGSIYRYLAKPWEPEDMRQTVRKAIELYALDRERSALFHELTLINELSRALHRELDLDRLLALLLDAAHHELGFDAASLLFFDGEEGALRWGGLEPDGTEVADRVREIEITEKTAPDFVQAMREGQTQALRLDDCDILEKPIQSWVMQVCAEEILVVPLAGNHEVIGALAIDNRSGGRRFGADDRTLLDGLAMQAVVAIENARLLDELRQYRNQAERADRLEMLGTLAAGLAREINNPLASIFSFLTLVPEKRHTNDELFWEQYHSMACSELERVRTLVATMARLATGSSETAEAQATEVSKLACQVLSQAQREANEARVVLDLEVDPDLPEVLLVRQHIQHVLLSLILSAIKGTSEDGCVRVRVHQGANDPGESVWLTVSDDGEGIPAERLDRIFDPFTNLEDLGQGTGVGLMVAQKIVSEHGGTIEVSSEPGEGTTFRVRLPVKGPEVRAS